MNKNIFDYYLEEYTKDKPKLKTAALEKFITWCKDKISNDKPTNVIYQGDGMVIRLQSNAMLAITNEPERRMRDEGIPVTYVSRLQDAARPLQDNSVKVF